MANVFGIENARDAGTLDAATALVTISAISSSVIASQISANYQRSIQRIHNMLDNKAYFSASRPEGNGSIGLIFGPVDGQSVWTALGDVCTGFDLAINGGGGRCGGTYRRALKGCKMNGIQLQMAAQDMLLNETGSFAFASYEE